MAKKSAKYNKSSIGKLANDKPVTYKIQTPGGKANYIGTAMKGRVQERIAEHLGEIPGAKVQIQQHSSIADARKSEANMIKRNQPKYNEQGK